MALLVLAYMRLLLARSFVQDQVFVSSCEAEHYAYSSAVKDLEYVRFLLSDLRIFLIILLFLRCLLTVSLLLPYPRVLLTVPARSTLLESFHGALSYN